MEDSQPLCIKSVHQNNPIQAIFLCKQCKEYLCEDCGNMHLSKYSGHDLKKIDEVFLVDMRCEEPGHNNNFEYFCKDHNKLICDKCIAKKINKTNNGQHLNCDTCSLGEIIDSKTKKYEESKKKLKEIEENIKVFQKQIKDKKDNLKEKIKKNLKQ